MGYYIFSYAIDVPKVKNVIGTIDPALFKAVMETEELDLYAEQDQPGYTTTRSALEHLLLGKRHSLFSRYDKSSAHKYWYAFIAVCGCLGKKLPASHDIKLSYETDLIDACLASDFGITGKIDELLLCEGNDLFGLPEVKDWPMCGLWDRAQLTVQHQRFASLDISDDQLKQLAKEDEEKEMAYDSIRQIKENIAYCLDKELSMITFCH